MNFFDDRYSCGVENWLSPYQVATFLQSIEIERVSCDLNGLTELMQAIYRTVPFQNLTMLTRPRTPPDKSQIISDMLDGIGGLCNTMNPFFAALLCHFGFRVGFIKTSMMQPDCHIGLAIELDNTLYWADLGNGFPYLYPLAIEHFSKARVLTFEYQLLAVNRSANAFKLEQNVMGKNAKRINQTFNLTLCDYSAFDDMRQRHYSEAQYGPFLTAIRLNRWQLDRGFLLRDDQITSFPLPAYSATREQILVWIEQNFKQTERLIHLIKHSWSILDEQSTNKSAKL